MEETIVDVGKCLVYSFKPEQINVIKRFVSKKDVFVAFPTGFGKSICFGCLPLFSRLAGHNQGVVKSIVVVVSPLLTLMEVQVSSFNSRGIVSTYIHSSI